MENHDTEVFTLTFKTLNSTMAVTTKLFVDKNCNNRYRDMVKTIVNTEFSNNRTSRLINTIPQ